MRSDVAIRMARVAAEEFGAAFGIGTTGFAEAFDGTAPIAYIGYWSSNAMWYSVVTNAENLPRNQFRDLVVQKAREGFLAYYPSFK